MFSEYVGLTQDVASFIEGKRLSPLETKSAILKRILIATEMVPEEAHKSADREFDFGQGVRIAAGETLYLYLSKPNSVNQKPDAMAEVREDGLYLDEVRVEPSHNSVIAPAMQMVQRKLGHLNSEGKTVSLSAYRQWHVVRDGKLVALDQLKSPELRRKRRSKASKVNVEALLAELGILTAEGRPLLATLQDF